MVSKYLFCHYDLRFSERVLALCYRLSRIFCYSTTTNLKSETHNSLTLTPYPFVTVPCSL